MTERLYVRVGCPGGYRKKTPGGAGTHTRQTQPPVKRHRGKPGHTRRRYDALMFMNKLQNPFPAPPGAAPPDPFWRYIYYMY